MAFTFTTVHFSEEWRYKILLSSVSLLFFAVSMGGALTVYHSYRQCKTMEIREQRQRECYQQIKNTFEMQQEHVKELTENPDFIEHVAREYMQVVGENEVLFRFE
jgi:cell division protein FtsB